MSRLAKVQFMFNRIENILPSVNERIKTILRQIYENGIMIFDEEDNDKIESFSVLFDELLICLDIQLCTNSNLIHDTQFQVLLEQSKIDMSKWRSKWSPLIIDQEKFHEAFAELIDLIESAVKIMSLVFENVSVTINVLLNF
ncbi:unnamed protein product [Rotaria sp. Silwood2]|nr:unnamed protein product [Rotaria sp. Silwood2]CAF3316058.1 unnamed protein product [Rotaria sp. Silwood2]CAF4243481.1 unnamed protein product [Rotaria sp. Silwood2]CAF4305522.1 unnamed protein product [Rotaria sp. Silwood2]